MFDTIRSSLHYLFLPHESNNYKARTLHTSYIIFYMVVLLMFQTYANIVRHTPPSILGYATDIKVENILHYVNLERGKANLPPLSLSNELSLAATQKASDMFSQNYWAHISPTGTTPWDFIKKSGYDYIYAGENLAKDFDYSEDVVAAWMKSPTHRANILKPEYTDIGVAIMNGELNGSETTLVVQEFGTLSPLIASEKEEKEKKMLLSSANTTNNQPETVNSQEAPFVGVLNKSEYGNNFWVVFKSSKKVSLLLAEFLLAVIFIDGLYIWKNRIYRVSGHFLSHIILFIALLGAMGATGVGVIL